MEQITKKRKKDIRIFNFLLFCYIFSFYITVFPVSMLIAIPLFICVCANEVWLRSFLKIFSNKFIFISFILQLLVTIGSLVFPIIYKTIDFSLGIIMITQMVHFICAIFFFTYIDVKDISFNQVCNSFIHIFIIQTISQVIVFLNQSTLAPIVRIFSHYDPDSVIGIGNNVRGVALSAATTYHLSLIYGVAFIIYIKGLIEKRAVTFFDLIKGLLVVVGIFFAGRTGFVGVGIGGLYFLITTHSSLRKKIKACLKLAITIGLIIVTFLSFAPKNMKTLVVDSLIPYAFEFIYQKLETGKTQSASTNELKEQWQHDFKERELLFGSGKYTEDGHYYMKCDAGILRHLLFGGIIFYLLIILYQAELTLPLKKGKAYYVFVLIFIYFCLMDFKGVTLGMNKFAYVTTLLFGYSYTREDKKSANYFLKLNYNA